MIRPHQYGQGTPEKGKRRALASLRAGIDEEQDGAEDNENQKKRPGKQGAAV